MAKIPRNKGKKGPAQRKGYSLKIKTYARKLYTIDKLKHSEISKKIYKKFNINVPASTLSTWYDNKNMEKVANIPEDRLNVNDKT